MLAPRAGLSQFLRGTGTVWLTGSRDVCTFRAAPPVVRARRPPLMEVSSSGVLSSDCCSRPCPGKHELLSPQFAQETSYGETAVCSLCSLESDWMACVSLPRCLPLALSSFILWQPYRALVSRCWEPLRVQRQPQAPLCGADRDRVPQTPRDPPAPTPRVPSPRPTGTHAPAVFGRWALSARLSPGVVLCGSEDFPLPGQTLGPCAPTPGLGEQRSRGRALRSSPQP